MEATSPKIPTFSIGSAAASKAVGIPLRTLNDMAKKGKIPAARRVGKRYLFVVDELRDWVNSHTIQTKGN